MSAERALRVECARPKPGTVQKPGRTPEKGPELYRRPRGRYRRFLLTSVGSLYARECQLPGDMRFCGRLVELAANEAADEGRCAASPAAAPSEGPIAGLNARSSAKQDTREECEGGSRQILPRFTCNGRVCAG